MHHLAVCGWWCFLTIIAGILLLYPEMITAGFIIFCALYTAVIGLVATVWISKKDRT